MRIRRSEHTRDLDDQLGIINYSSVIPSIRRHRTGEPTRFRVEPFLRPMSFGYVSWIAFLLFYLLFGRIMVFYLMMGGFAGPTRGVELRLFRTVHVSDLESFRGGATVKDHMGRVVLDPDRDSVYELAISPGFHRSWDFGSSLCGVCDDARESGKTLTIAVLTNREATYQDFVSGVETAKAMDYLCGCQPWIVLVSQ